LLDHQNNYVGRSTITNKNVAKNFDILTTRLNVLHNYFDGLIKLFSNLYLTKFLDTSNRSFRNYQLIELKFHEKGELSKSSDV